MNEFTRSPETIALNESLEIVNIAGLMWRSKYGLGYHIVNDWDKDKWTFKTSEGYLSADGYYPYCPLGGKKALQAILDQGGFMDYDHRHFIQPVNR